MRRHYHFRSRPEAALALTRFFAEAVKVIASDPSSGLPAPRPYPELAREGRAWLHVGRYWFYYSLQSPLTLLAVFYDSANIPQRL